MSDWLASFPTLSALQPEDRAWAVNWLRHANGDWGRDRNSKPYPTGNLAADLTRTRQHRPHAAQWLVMHNTTAAQIAIRAGWRDEPAGPRQPTAEALAHVAQTLKALEPQDPERTAAEQRDALTGLSLRPKHLTPEQLDQANPLPNGRKRT